MGLKISLVMGSGAGMGMGFLGPSIIEESRLKKRVQSGCGYPCGWWCGHEVGTQAGWWSVENFKHIPTEARMGLKIFLVMDSGAGMRMRFLGPPHSHNPIDISTLSLS